MEKLTQAQIKAAVEQQIRAIVQTLYDGERVMLLPSNKGIKIVKVTHTTIK